MLLYNEILCAIFREKTGFTFNRYLNPYRLNPSALLLKNSLPAAGAAFARGFNSLPCFYKRFREYCHMTPQDFQKNGK
ncbi:helix-turn-helix domain-containing protein [Otoolea muris]|uniref:helix-turn-helix domain-containing protein n=1 Tax=Otoolea muris TaxID=2941515 RepID=UPI003A7F13D8